MYDSLSRNELSYRARAQIHAWKRRTYSHGMEYLRFSLQKGPRREGSFANVYMKNVADANVTCIMYASLLRQALSYRALSQMHTWKPWRRKCSSDMKYLRFSPQKGPMIEGSCANACMKNVSDAHVTCIMYACLRRRARSYRAFSQIRTLKTS